MSYEPLPIPERPRLRPPVGIPVPPVSRRKSVLAAIAVHALVIALLIVPLAAPAVVRAITGTDAPTASGGGGGGLRGTGGDRGGPPVVERLRYVQIVTPAPAVKPPPAVTQPVTPPVLPPPVVKPPVAPKPAPAATPAPTPPVSSVTAPVAGSGGGTGADGTLGSGPGTGGGVGSGVGTGQGSGVGPAAQGNNVAAAPAPTLIETFLPPNGVSKRDKGKTIVAVFDVDSTGRVLKVDFTQVSDGGYNRKLREVFEAFRFRPAVRPDGTPIRAKTSFEYVL